MTSPKQAEQYKLRQALGTCKGFHGYLHNLKRVIADCTPKEELLFTGYFLEKDINSLHHQLAITEEHIKKQLKNLDKLFPPADSK